MSDISKNIKRLRQEKALTQDELAEKLHVTRQAVSNWENDKNHPDIELLMGMAELFEVDINELLYRPVQKQNSSWRWLPAWTGATVVFVMWAALWIFGWSANMYKNATYVATYDWLYRRVLLGVAYLLSGVVLSLCIRQWRDLYVRDKRVRRLLLVFAVIPPLLYCVFGVCSIFGKTAWIRSIELWYVIYLYPNPWIYLLSGWILGCLVPIRSWGMEQERGRKRWMLTLLLLCALGAGLIEWLGTVAKTFCGTALQFHMSTAEARIDWLKALAFLNFGGTVATFLWSKRDIAPKTKRGKICLAVMAVALLISLLGLVSFDHAIYRGAFLSYPEVRAFGRWLLKQNFSFLFIIPGFLLLCSLLPKREQRVDFPENIQ